MKLDALGWLGIVCSICMGGQAWALGAAQVLEQKEPLPVFFGAAVAVSATDLLIARAGETVGVSSYVRGPRGWTKGATALTTSGGTPFVPSEIALDGDTALASRWSMVSLLTRQAGVWSQSDVKFSDGVPPYDDRYGLAAALANGVALVAAPGTNTVYTYLKGNGDWLREDPPLHEPDSLTPGNVSFGWDLAFDGHTLLVACLSHLSSGEMSSGAVHVFLREGEAWLSQATLTVPSSENLVSFGWTVAISGDTALIGARIRDESNQSRWRGAAYVFVRKEGVWQQQGERLLAPNVFRNDEFGTQLALVGDTALLGAPTSISGTEETGAAYTFTRTGSTWGAGEPLPNGPLPVRGFGRSVALSEDSIVIGAPGVDMNQGAAFVFDRTEAMAGAGGVDDGGAAGEAGARSEGGTQSQGGAGQAGIAGTTPPSSAGASPSTGGAKAVPPADDSSSACGCRVAGRVPRSGHELALLSMAMLASWQLRRSGRRARLRRSAATSCSGTRRSPSR